MVGGKAADNEEQAVEGLSQMEGRCVRSAVTHNNAAIVDHEAQEGNGHGCQAPELQRQQRPALHPQCPRSEIAPSS